MWKADEMHCNPLPISIVEGAARMETEAAAGFTRRPVVRRAPRVAPADVKAEREARLARMGARPLPWRVVR